MGKYADKLVNQKIVVIGGTSGSALPSPRHPPPNHHVPHLTKPSQHRLRRRRSPPRRRRHRNRHLLLAGPRQPSRHPPPQSQCPRSRRRRPQRSRLRRDSPLIGTRRPYRVFGGRQDHPRQARGSGDRRGETPFRSQVLGRRHLGQRSVAPTLGPILSRRYLPASSHLQPY